MVTNDGFFLSSLTTHTKHALFADFYDNRTMIGVYSIIQ